VIAGDHLGVIADCAVEKRIDFKHMTPCARLRIMRNLIIGRQSMMRCPSHSGQEMSVVQRRDS
jgi:hypothetical protein